MAIATLADGVVRPGLLLAVLVGVVGLGRLGAQVKEVEDDAQTMATSSTVMVTALLATVRCSNSLSLRCLRGAMSNSVQPS